VNEVGEREERMGLVVVEFRRRRSASGKMMGPFDLREKSPQRSFFCFVRIDARQQLDLDVPRAIKTRRQSERVARDARRRDQRCCRILGLEVVGFIFIVAVFLSALFELDSEAAEDREDRKRRRALRTSCFSRRRGNICPHHSIASCCVDVEKERRGK